MKLPRTLKYLIWLRHLHIRDHVMLPPEIGRLTSLQTLPHFSVGCESGYQIEELSSLKKLKGKLKICNLENVLEKEEAEKANIFQNPNLLQLGYEWDSCLEGGERNDANVLEGLQPHPNRQKLEIDGFKGKRFPLWIMKMAVRDEAQGSWVGLNKLVEVRLSGCKECEEIPALGHLPNLKHLRLQGFQNVKSINSSFYGIDSVGICQDTIIVFPVLERLELYGMTNQREWTKIEFPETRPHEVKVFPRLYLTISGCKRLMSAPSHFSTCLKTLDISWMGSRTPLANICEVTLMSLPDLHIVGVDGLECLPDWLFHNNQNLSKLIITNCYELRELPDGLHNLNYVEELTILDCWNLKSIGNPSGSKGQSRGSLRRLEVKNCVGLMDLPHGMVESWAPSLEAVTLDNLCSLKNLPRVIECITKSTRLTKLRIVGVPEFMATRGVESWHFRSLRELEIDVSVESSRESIVAIKETVDALLRGCSHSLVKLDLRGLKIWECLPESIQNLSGLSWLTLHNFGIQELPEWFGNLSSLKHLTIKHCPELHIDSNPHRHFYISVHGPLRN